MSDSGPATTRRTRVIVAAIGVAIIIVVGLVAVRLSGSGDGSGTDGEPGAGSSTGPTDSPTPEPTDATPTDAASPGQPTTEESSGDASDGPGSGDPSSSTPVRVDFDDAGMATDELRVSVARVEKVRSEAGLPGETSRPALRITVRVDNDSDDTVPIGTALTNVYYGPDRTPANLVSRPGGRPFPSEVASGEAATGVFVYNVPRRARDRVVLEVIVDAEARSVEFTGDCTEQC